MNEVKSNIKELLGVRIISMCRSIISLPCLAFLYLRRQKAIRRIKKEEKGERIIVSLTSWAKRIENVPATLDSILANTVKPDIIVLNLSSEEFPGGEKDLPQEVSDYLAKNGVEMIWNEGNNKAFKKIIPTMRKYPNDAIISIDDDFIYPNDFIKTFVEKHEEFPFTPLTGNMAVVGGSLAHCGCASLVKGSFFGKYLDELCDDTIINMGLDDVFYTFCAYLNGFSYTNVGRMFFYNMTPNNPVDALSESSASIPQMKSYLEEKIRTKYHIDISVLSKPFFCI